MDICSLVNTRQQGTLNVDGKSTLGYDDHQGKCPKCPGWALGMSGH
jgi:hypothetical protein